jgi:hypothetical protein
LKSEKTKCGYLEGERAKLQTHVKELAVRIEQERRENDTDRQQLHKEQLALKIEKEQHTNTQKELQHTRMLNDQLKMKNQHLNDQLARITQTSTKEQGDTQQLRKEIERLQTENQRLQTEYGAQIDRQMIKLEEMLKTYKEVDKVHSELSTRNAALNKELECLRQQLAQKENLLLSQTDKEKNKEQIHSHEPSHTRKLMNTHAPYVLWYFLYYFDIVVLCCVVLQNRVRGCDRRVRKRFLLWFLPPLLLRLLLLLRWTRGSR